jgi:hypothetical protein
MFKRGTMLGKAEFLQQIFHPRASGFMATLIELRDVIIEKRTKRDRDIELGCGPTQTDVDRKFFQGLIPSFCSNQRVQDGKSVSKTLTNEDFQTPARKRAALRKRAPPPSADQYEGFKFHFSFSGGNDCRQTCEEALLEIQGQCTSSHLLSILRLLTTYQGTPTTALLSTGAIDAGCGIYSYEIEAPEKPQPNPSTPQCYTPASADTSAPYLHWAQLDNIIPQFCSYVESEYASGSTATWKSYNVDTLDHVLLTALFATSDVLSNEEVKDHCLEHLRDMGNACERDAEFKIGGNKALPGIGYGILPLHPRPFPIPDEPTTSCRIVTNNVAGEVQYKFLVGGSLYAGADYGADSILPELGTCVGVEGWKFEYLESPRRGEEWAFEFRHRDVDDKRACIKDALVRAGASENFECVSVKF